MPAGYIHSADPDAREQGALIEEAWRDSDAFQTALLEWAATDPHAAEVFAGTAAAADAFDAWYDVQAAREDIEVVTPEADR